MSDCGRKRTGKTPIPFNCKSPTGHVGKCTPYTLPPTTNWHDYLDLLARLQAMRVIDRSSS